METQQERQGVTLETIYKIMKNIQQELHQINEKLDWESEFREEEDKEFIKGTREAWKEIDEGKGITMSKEEFLKELKNW